MRSNKNSLGQRQSLVSNSEGKIFRTILVGILISIMLASPLQAGDDTSLDKYFREFAVRYFNSSVDWRLFKAQGVVESGLVKNARSHRGARGVMQIMPVTYKEIQQKSPVFKSRSLESVPNNINAGVFYNHYLYQRWDGEVSAEQRIKLMLASYNAGYSRVLKAFNKAGAPENDWWAVQYYLPKETQNYVSRVMKRFHAELVKPEKPATSNIFLSKADGDGWDLASSLD